MGNFSRDTFKALKHYVAVRLQQGVPLLDADWNEAFDIRKNELETFLKWFVGDGVPKGNDGFAIVPLEEAKDDFLIKGGDGTPWGAGRCLVEGWEVLNEDDLNYSEQPFDLPVLNPPDNDRTDLVYLDIWERDIEAGDDFDKEYLPSMKDPDINLETCVRVRREWVVRVAEGEESKEDPAAFKDGEHVYYPLAQLHHVKEDGEIVLIVEDLRRTGVAGLSREITIEDGKVGIAEKEPHERLQIGSSERGGVTFHDGGNKALAWNAYLDWPAREWRYLSGKSAAKIYVNYDEKKFFIRTAAKGTPEAPIVWSSALAINEEGEVGIGTSQPEARLDIRPLEGEKWLRLGGGGDRGRVWIDYDQEQDFPFLVLSDLDNPPRLIFQQIGYEDGSTEENPQYASWIGHAKSGSNDIALMGGKVGIGTRSPENSLHVKGEDGSIALEGANPMVKWYKGGDDQELGAWSGFMPKLTGPSREFALENILDGGSIRLQTKNGGCHIRLATVQSMEDIVNYDFEIGHVVRGLTTEVVFNVLSVDQDGNLRVTKSIECGKASCDGETWIDHSSIESKKDINPLSIEQAIETLQDLEPVTFKRKNDIDGRRQVGFIAEEVPDLVATKNRNGVRAIDIVAVLTKVVRYQQQQISELANRLNREHDESSEFCG